MVILILDEYVDILIHENREKFRHNYLEPKVAPSQCSFYPTCTRSKHLPKKQAN